MDDIQSLGVGGIFLILIMRQVLDFLSKQQKGKRCEGFAKDDREMLRELHDWHDQRGDDGVPVWYVRKSLEACIHELSDTIGKMRESQDAQNRALILLAAKIEDNELAQFRAAKRR